jgi:hypothetical protein
MFAVSLDNLLFILLIGVAALFQLLSKALRKTGKSEPEETSPSPTPTRPPPIRRAPTESDAERIRKFLEALGQPPTSTPPPPIAPRTDIPPRRLAPVQPSPIIPGTWRSPREQRQKPDVIQRESPPPETPKRAEKMLPPATTTTPVFEVQPPIVKTPVEVYAATTRTVAKGADLKTDVAALLASKSGLREAIILREIFGSPRGLQEVDATL